MHRFFRILRVFAVFSCSLFFSSCSHPHTTPEKPVPTKNADTSHAALIRHEYPTGELASLCDKYRTEADSALAALAATPATARSFSNSVLRFDEILSQLGNQTLPLAFMSYVSPNDGTRAEATACNEAYSKYLIGVFTRRDLYSAVKAQIGRDAGERRLHYRLVQKFEESGLKLSDDHLKVAKQKLEMISALESRFSANLINDTSTIDFTADQLQGVPESIIGRLKRTADGKYTVTTKVTDYFGIMQNAKLSETRHAMLFAFNNRQAAPNTKLLASAIGLRNEVGPLLGFKTWADYKINGRMAKDADEVFEFLGGLRPKLSARNKHDLATLLKFKKELDPRTTHLNPWDLAYLDNQFKKRNLSLDKEAIREYFPAQPTIQRVFQLYGKLFGIQFIQVANIKAWAPDVKLYEIWDRQTGNILAYFYADFVPRPGKFEHFAMFPLRAGYRGSNGKYIKPIAAIVGNFEPPSGSRPSLLSHEEVATLLHEFGHVLHHTLSTVPYGTLSGTSVATDFVEAPSQMLEQWAWNARSLHFLSGHYKNASEKLPEATIRQILRSRKFNQGYFYTRQLLYALLDMNYHTATEPLDPIDVYRDDFKEVIGFEPMPGDHFPAQFAHIMGDGYDAGYYGYLWSEVYALDMASKFARNGMFNPKTGLRYRRDILERGDLEEATDLVQSFLHRPSNSAAFFRMLGLQPEPAHKAKRHHRRPK